MSGFTIGLFHAIDSADRVAIDGIDLEEGFVELPCASRRLQLAHECVLHVADQDVNIDGGSASFHDTDGEQHSIEFWVEKHLEDFDLLDLREGECGRCGSLPAARDETCPQCSPEVRPARYMAQFLPQAWQNDYANEVDPEGPTTWDVTAHMEKLTEAQRGAVLAQDAEPWDYNDHLKGMPGAPEWVRDWSGPFEINVTACGGNCSCRMTGAAGPRPATALHPA